MVHAGGAYGGHYYAYIKDFETNKWFHFNDTVVREISFLDLLEVFGQHPEKGRKGMAQKRLGFNAASAYMLKYRIINDKEDTSSLVVHEEEIPEEIRQDVTKSDTS